MCTMYAYDGYKLICEVTWDPEIAPSGKVHVINHIGTKCPYMPYITREGDQYTVRKYDLDLFLETRCLPKSRVDIERRLRFLNIDKFNLYDICKKTYGRMYSDYVWLRFDDKPDFKGMDIFMNERYRDSYMMGETGDQRKSWKSDILFKYDTELGESSKEVSASRIAAAFDLNHVHYARFRQGADKPVWYCTCASYLPNYASSISFDKIITYYDGWSSIGNNTSAKVLYSKVSNWVHEFTGLPLQYIKAQIMNTLVFDFLIANEDRHLNNFEVIKYEKGYDLAPIYDNGNAFFGIDRVTSVAQIKSLSQKFKSKPFSTNQFKNLINLEEAQAIASSFLEKATAKYEDISSIPGVLEGHSKILKYRMKELLNKGV